MPFFRIDEQRNDKWNPLSKGWYKSLDHALGNAKSRSDRTGYDCRAVPITVDEFNEGIVSDMDWLGW